MELEIYSPQRVERRRICALVPTTHFACIEMIFAATALTAGHSSQHEARDEGEEERASRLRNSRFSIAVL